MPALTDNQVLPPPSPVVSFLRFFDFRNRLARYVLREHIGPFIFSFAMITFVLIIDFVPNLVDMIVGKDLPTSVILRVFVYQIGWMVALSVPMAILVATLMAFGRLTSDFEITAVKASGIPVLRIIYPVVVASGVVAYGMVLFHNQILPDLNHRARILMQDIKRMRPTLQMRSGAFVTDIPGYIILIDSVDHKASDLTGVKIMETEKRQSSPRTIVAQSGHLTFTNNGRDLIFDLRDGEIHEFDPDDPDKYRRLAFANQRLVISDVSKEFQESDDQFRTDREKSARQMMEDILKWQSGIVPYRAKISEMIGARIDKYFGGSFPRSADSLLPDHAALANLARIAEADSRIVAREREGIATQQKLINSYYVEVHKKYSIPVACLVFVLIGAPLGILARRGSMGISIGISLGLFVLYWAFLIGGEDLADRSIIPAFWAMWSANILIGAAGLFLIFVVSTEIRPWTIFRLTRESVRRKS